MAVENILIGYAKIWTAPVGTAFPAASIGYGVAWGGAWTYLGDTLEPLSLTIERTTFEVMIQQSNQPVKQAITDQPINFSTTMAEHTAGLLNKVLLGTVVTTAPATGVPGYDTLEFGGETTPNVLAVGFEALYQTAANVSLPVRYMFWRGSITLGGDIPFDKGAAAGIPINIQVLSDTTKAVGQQTGRIQIVNVAAL